MQGKSVNSLEADPEIDASLCAYAETSNDILQTRFVNVAWQIANFVEPGQIQFISLPNYRR